MSSSKRPKLVRQSRCGQQSSLNVEDGPPIALSDGSIGVYVGGCLLLGDTIDRAVGCKLANDIVGVIVSPEGGKILDLEAQLLNLSDENDEVIEGFILGLEEVELDISGGVAGEVDHIAVALSRCWGNWSMDVTENELEQVEIVVDSRWVDSRLGGLGYLAAATVDRIALVPVQSEPCLDVVVDDGLDYSTTWMAKSQME